MDIVLPGGVKATLAGSLRMREFRAMTEADARGDYQGVYPFLAKLVQEWSATGENQLPLDQKDPAAYDELTLPQYRELVRQVAEYLRGDSPGEV